MKRKIEKALKYPDGYIKLPHPLKYDVSGDPRNDYQYCTLLMEHAKECERALEIGSSIGISSRHIAEGLPEDGLLICVDICTNYVDPKVFHAIRDYKSNIHTLEMNSCVAEDDVKALLKGHLLDMLYIDATHDFNWAYGEYLRYRKLVKHGGIIFFDDLNLHPQMEFLWKSIKEEKHRHDELHWTGFGYVVKDDNITPAGWETLIPDCPPLN